MIEVRWLEQTEADIPQKNEWLSANEADRLNTLRFSKRRADWRLGRWTAKRALAAYLNLPDDPETLARIEIRPAPSGAPEVFIAEQAAAIAISISHRSGRAICAISCSGVALGCDLELIEPRCEAFISDYFTIEEQALISGTPPAGRNRVATLLWSAKESTLKALGLGLRLDTRCVPVCVGEEVPDLTFPPSHEPSGWHPLKVRYTEGRAFQGWWRQQNDFALTVVAAPPPAPPLSLRILA